MWKDGTYTIYTHLGICYSNSLCHAQSTNLSTSCGTLRCSPTGLPTGRSCKRGLESFSAGWFSRLITRGQHVSWSMSRLVNLAEMAAIQNQRYRGKWIRQVRPLSDDCRATRPIESPPLFSSIDCPAYWYVIFIRLE
jgi:hypothetical protein